MSGGLKNIILWNLELDFSGSQYIPIHIHTHYAYEKVKYYCNDYSYCYSQIFET
jgi:hypothetical protein